MTAQKRSRKGHLARVATGVPLAAALAGIAYSKLFVPHALELPPALKGERREFASRAGRLSYYVAGPSIVDGAAPLLLIHSLNAAASAYEVRPLFDHYRQSRRVYALDLPGFGFSERSERDYTPRLYTDAVLEMLAEIGRESGAEPVDALALSLGSEFLARAAVEQPGRFATIALVSPTGFRRGDSFYGSPASSRGLPFLNKLYEFPLWAQALFDLLNSRASQRYFLARTFGSHEAIDQGLLEYDYLTAHQPGARHAAYAFISAIPFGADINRVYDSLALPVWMAHGVRGDFTDYSGTGKLATRPNWEQRVFQTGAIPYFELPGEFFAAYDAFVERAQLARRM
ncbi:MAG TPA: alpha/beta fold hydrolase [Roseiflexaceae bacterium]|nr:alpha/beta fold hydrolase [Roseiflexaceae bacterium]